MVAVFPQYQFGHADGDAVGHGEEKFGPPKTPPGHSPLAPAPTDRPRLIRAHGESAPISWQPTPFVPWHQPFFNESGIYAVAITLPADQHLVCSGSVRRTTPLPGCKTGQVWLGGGLL